MTNIFFFQKWTIRFLLFHPKKLHFIAEIRRKFTSLCVIGSFSVRIFTNLIPQGLHISKQPVWVTIFRSLELTSILKFFRIFKNRDKLNFNSFVCRFVGSLFKIDANFSTKIIIKCIKKTIIIVWIRKNIKDQLSF